MRWKERTTKLTMPIDMSKIWMFPKISFGNPFIEFDIHEQCLTRSSICWHGNSKSKSQVSICKTPHKNQILGNKKQITFKN